VDNDFGWRITLRLVDKVTADEMTGGMITTARDGTLVTWDADDKTDQVPLFSLTAFFFSFLFFLSFSLFLFSRSLPSCVVFLSLLSCFMFQTLHPISYTLHPNS